MPDPEPLEALLEAALARMGMPAPSVFQKLADTWEELAGEPWSHRATPLYIRQRELVVEAASASLVGMLRYGVGDLMRRLDEALGPGVVESVRVIPPGRSER